MLFCVNLFYEILFLRNLISLSFMWALMILGIFNDTFQLPKLLCWAMGWKGKEVVISYFNLKSQYLSEVSEKNHVNTLE
jgi:hypothetical protein